MAASTSPLPFPLLLFLMVLSLLFQANLSSSADDSISISQPISGNQTIVSKGGNFELGFFTPGNSWNYYIGIWNKKVSVQTVVWVANRDKPIKNIFSSELKISGDGTLVLLDQSKNQIWSTNLTLSDASNSTVAVILDSGNLVLVDESNSSAVFWQSFDHPTNTWLQGAKFGLNKVTKQNMLLTSWKSNEDPSPGPFSFGIDPDGSSQYILWWNGTQQYFTTGVWNGKIFSYLPEMIPITAYNIIHVDNERENYFTYSLKNKNIYSGIFIDVNGQVRQSKWLNDTQEWNLFWSQPRDQCQVYSLCGAFGVCNERKFPFCTCLNGFEESSPKEWSSNDYTSGCVRNTPLQCGNGSSANRSKDGFLEIAVVKLSVNSVSVQVGSNDECKSACLNNCWCSAYSYNDLQCLVWNGGLLNLEEASNGDTDGLSIFIRVANINIPSGRRKNSTLTGVVISVTGGSLFLLGFFLCLVWVSRRRGQIGPQHMAEDGSLVVYSYRHLQQVTNNFSDMIGRGGFGSIFKGVLSDLSFIAVKRLEGIKQGDKQFRTEVSTLGRIQHVNLVRLRGFCAEGVERMLVYDYMPNGSLDSLLFGESSIVLDWKIRYQIALGVARGLAYLHEKCRECIIHCDVKPENVLLDSKFRAKLADFGLAKLIGRDFSRVLTTTRGTIGYLAPEWISGLPITPKADVYSFGMVLLEIISGRRNANLSEDGESSFFPLLAASKVNEGEVLSLIDEKLEGNCDAEELSRACKVACWCIQGNEIDRPSMGQVVQMLERASEVDVPPVPTHLLDLLGPLDDCVPLSEFSTESNDKLE